MMNITEIQEILPHRSPFLLIDRVLCISEEEQTVVALKNITMNEPFFAGHFPGHPVMPGVLIIEALAQAGAVYVLSLPEYRGKIAYFTGIEQARFRGQVVPGDQLRLEVKLDQLRRGIGHGTAHAYVEDRLVCEARISFAVR